MTDLVSVSDAAAALGLDRSRVRALAASGELSARKIGGVWLIERASIEQRREHPSPAGRPLIASNAWRVLLLASGEDIDKGADPVARWRVRDALDRRGLDALRRLLRRHAAVHCYWGLPGELRRLRERDDVVLAGTSAAAGHHLDLLSGDGVDVFVSASRAPGVEREHALARAAVQRRTSCCDSFQTTRGRFSPAVDSRPWRPSRSVWPRTLIHAPREPAVR